MTPKSFLYKTLNKVCHGAYVAYAPGSKNRPSLPFYVYSPDEGEEVFADSENYSRLPRFRVELFFKENDPELIDDFEAALSELGTWRLRRADWLDTESCLWHDYRLSLSLGKMRESEVG